MARLILVATLAAAATVALVAPAGAAGSPTCKVAITGGMTRSFDCKAGLNHLSKWVLTLGGASSLPVDFGGMLTFAAQPAAGTYHMDDLSAVYLLATDKHDKSGDGWTASMSKTSPFPHRPPAPPVGALTLRLTAVGPGAEVHGTLEATLKPYTMNTVHKDVVLSFNF